MTESFLQFLLTFFFLTIVFFHVAKKNFGVAIAYGLQSLVVVTLLVISFFETRNLSILAIAFLMLIVKVILAPIFIVNLIRKHNLTFLVSTYVSLPLTLIIVAALAGIAHSAIFSSLINIVPANHQFLSLALAALLISIFLTINRRGAISQIIGVLSLENSMVVFAFFAGLEQSPALQLGIAFDIIVWFMIATIFISMIYKHFGSLDVTEMKQLKD
jgi:hydrogenase-4 component E